MCDNDTRKCTSFAVLGQGTLNYPKQAKARFNVFFDPCQADQTSRKVFHHAGGRRADTADLINRWPSDHGIGIRAAKITGINIDVFHPDVICSAIKKKNTFHLLRTQQGSGKCKIHTLEPVGSEIDDFLATCLEKRNKRGVAR